MANYVPQNKITSLSTMSLSNLRIMFFLRRAWSTQKVDIMKKYIKTLQMARDIHFKIWGYQVLERRLPDTKQLLTNRKRPKLEIVTYLFRGIYKLFICNVGKCLSDRKWVIISRINRPILQKEKKWTQFNRTNK